MSFPTVTSHVSSRHIRFNQGLLFCWPPFPESSLVNWDFLICVPSPCRGHQAVLTWNLSWWALSFDLVTLPPSLLKREDRSYFISVIYGSYLGAPNIVWQNVHWWLIMRELLRKSRFWKTDITLFGFCMKGGPLRCLKNQMSKTKKESSVLLQ